MFKCNTHVSAQSTAAGSETKADTTWPCKHQTNTEQNPHPPRVLPSSNNNQQRNANKENKDCVDRYSSGHFGSDPDIMQVTRAGGKVCMAKPQPL